MIELHMVTYMLPSVEVFVISCTINSKYFQHLDLHRSFLSLGLAFIINIGVSLSDFNTRVSQYRSLRLTILYP